MMEFICYPQCTTCQRARRWLDENRIGYTLRDIKQSRPTEAELRHWIEASGLPVRRFFNTSGIQYRELGLKDKLPAMSEDEQIRLLASDGMLVRRPIVAENDFVMIGFKEADWARVFGR